ncbi:hypothetical protein F4861DRAFT_257647 [Xylaria intraflava]|nr:hypothetical protein F4861DRAFT_257647 [Xylaria intraflava]
MAASSFPLFTSFPYELRQMIYLLASPPRFVHIQEAHENREEFIERFRTTPVQVKLHPSIAHFARNWRESHPWRSSSMRQATLDAYGFTGGPDPRHQPWESTSEVPGIPHHLLTENSGVAWEFVRAGYFYSAAPIPALLHVTRESRYALMESGYELAFRTRSCGPKTWFNFETDVLYLGNLHEYWSSHEFHFLLSGNHYWDIGQFEPVDMNRVKRLALADSGGAASCTSRTGTQDVSSILALFPGVEELFLEECGLRGLAYRFPHERQPNDTALWTYTPVLEADVLSDLLHNESMVASTGYNNQGLKAHKEDYMGDGTGFFINTAAIFGDKLRTWRDGLVHSDSSTPWKIPKISIVHIDYPWIFKGLFAWRWDAWHRFQGLKEDDSLSKALEEAHRSTNVPKTLVFDKNEDLPPSPFSEEFRDDMEALQDMMDEAQVGAYDDGDLEEYNELRAWVSRRNIAAPDAESHDVAQMSNPFDAWV